MCTYIHATIIKEKEAMNLRKVFMGRLEKKKRGNEVIMFQKITTIYIDTHTSRYIDRKKKMRFLYCLIGFLVSNLQ